MDKEDEQKMQTAISVVDMQRGQDVGGDEDEQQDVLER